jgi:hypothetical protein
MNCINQNAKASNSEIYITMDKDNGEHVDIPNSSYELYIHGNVTCQYDNFGINVQRIEVDIIATNNNDWNAKIVPNHLTFYEKGRYPINLNIQIPTNEFNNTKAPITIFGNWHTESNSNSINDESGSFGPITVNVTFIRAIEFHKSEPEKSDYDKSPNVGDYYHWFTIFILFGIPIILITTIIYLVAKRVHEWYLWNRYK